MMDDMCIRGYESVQRVATDRKKRLHLIIPCNFTFRERCIWIPITILPHVQPKSHMTLEVSISIHKGHSPSQSSTERLASEETTTRSGADCLNRCHGVCEERIWIKASGYRSLKYPNPSFHIWAMSRLCMAADPPAEGIRLRYHATAPSPFRCCSIYTSSTMSLTLSKALHYWEQGSAVLQKKSMLFILLLSGRASHCTNLALKDLVSHMG